MGSVPDQFLIQKYERWKCVSGISVGLMKSAISLVDCFTLSQRDKQEHSY